MGELRHTQKPPHEIGPFFQIHRIKKNEKHVELSLWIQDSFFHRFSDFIPPVVWGH